MRRQDVSSNEHHSWRLGIQEKKECWTWVDNSGQERRRGQFWPEAVGRWSPDVVKVELGIEKAMGSRT